mgnify:FL=1
MNRNLLYLSLSFISHVSVISDRCDACFAACSLNSSMAPLAHKPIFVEASVGLKIDRTCSHLQPLVHKVFLSSHKLTAVAGKNSHSILLDVFYKPHYSSSYKICIKPCLHHFRKRSTKVRSLYGSDDGVVGDSKLQQVLVDMVRIQVGKVRMIEFVDERSQYLRNIADEATFEYDQIAYRTMKGLDATGSRVRDLLLQIFLGFLISSAIHLFDIRSHGLYTNVIICVVIL